MALFASFSLIPEYLLRDEFCYFPTQLAPISECNSLLLETSANLRLPILPPLDRLTSPILEEVKMTIQSFTVRKLLSG